MVGDVVGKPGRRVLKRCLNELRSETPLDFVTVNGENLAGGFGVTTKIFHEVMDSGVDVMTMGNHWHNKPDVHALRNEFKTLVLPRNLPNVDGVDHIPRFSLSQSNLEVAIVNLMGNFGMKETYNSPFDYLERKKGELTAFRQSGQGLVLVDFHGEASSEKQVTAHYLDGIATALIGTHTHTPTSDERVTKQGTALLTDVGMTGPYDSVIGMCKSRALKRYFGQKQKSAHEVAETPGWFCGFFIEVNKETKRSDFAHRIQWREEEARWRVSSVQRSTL
jgi:2',3'-cyclic-nucleotide 2'-phosphodiesterase